MQQVETVRPIARGMLLSLTSVTVILARSARPILSTPRPSQRTAARARTLASTQNRAEPISRSEALRDEELFASSSREISSRRTTLSDFVMRTGK